VFVLEAIETAMATAANRRVSRFVSIPDRYSAGNSWLR
jgi:hypothetical protein